MKNKENLKDFCVSMRMSSESHKKIKLQADKNQMSFTEFMTKISLHAVERNLIYEETLTCVWRAVI